MKTKKKEKKLEFKKETIARLTGPEQAYIRGGDSTVVNTQVIPAGSSKHCISYNVTCNSHPLCQTV